MNVDSTYHLYKTKLFSKYRSHSLRWIRPHLILTTLEANDRIPNQINVTNNTCSIYSAIFSSICLIKRLHLFRVIRLATNPSHCCITHFFRSLKHKEHIYIVMSYGVNLCPSNIQMKIDQYIHGLSLSVHFEDVPLSNIILGSKHRNCFFVLP